MMGWQTLASIRNDSGHNVLYVTINNRVSDEG
jgi:hypothetical protein